MDKKELGKRLKRARTAKGWTQAELAERANTTVQNISKYEREGIGSVDAVDQLSRILGRDLSSAEKEQEGTVGEIGKEILIKLIENKGMLAFDKMVKENLYGLNAEKASNEVFKLLCLGLCVRENYEDFDGKERDILFITAKGLITCKNAISNPLIIEKIKEWLPKVITLENRLKDHLNLNIKSAESIEEYIDARRDEKLIRNLPLTEYRTNYTTYLKRAFLFQSEELSEKRIYMGPQNHLCLFPGVNFYSDTIHSMIADISENNKIALIKEYQETEISTEEIIIISEIEKHKKLDETLEYVMNNTYTITVEDILDYYYDDVAGESIKKEDEKLLIEEAYSYEAEEKQRHEFKKLVKERYDYLKEKTGKSRPSEFFSYEEIEVYVKSNLKKAKNDTEKNIDKVIAEINALRPQTLNYYMFPEEWEEKGLADYVRKFYGIKK